MINEIERIKEDSNSGVMSNVFIFIAEHPINERLLPIDELINWSVTARKHKKEQALAINRSGEIY